HGGAVATVEILLLAEGFVMGGVEEFCDVVANALVDLLPEVEVVRIERVVEIEHPGLDVSEGAWRGTGRWVGQRGRGHGGLVVFRFSNGHLARVPQPPPVRSLM